MPNVNITIRMDDSLKHDADVLFEDLGMSFTTAVNIFVKQAVREGRIPFDVTARPSVRYAMIKLPSESDDTSCGDPGELLNQK